MQFKSTSIFNNYAAIIFCLLLLYSCNNSESSEKADNPVKKINLRRHPLPYPPSADSLSVKDTIAIYKALDSLLTERDSLQNKLLFTTAEAIQSEAKTKMIKVLEKSFDLNTDYVVKLQMGKSICNNKDDSQPVELYNGLLGVSKKIVDKMAKSVGQLQWKYSFGEEFTGPNDSEGNVKGVRWCTGTLIDKDIFITAGHCFDNDGNGWSMPVKNGQLISSADIAKLMKVNFNYQIDKNTGNIRADTIDFPVLELKEYRNGCLDYAIIRLGKNIYGEYPGEKFGVIEVSATAPSVNDMAAIIQHPLGNPKVIEAGRIFSINFNLLNYDDIDTQGGSSGAAVISTLNNRIVGIHVLGGCDNFKDGSNHATPIYLITPNSPIVKSLAR